MYTGNNPTALQSRQWFLDSLIALMQEMPYQDITIRMICKRADLSRQTFYNLFENKEEILHCCLRQLYLEEFDKLSKKNHISLYDTIESFSAVLEHNRTLLALMIDNHLESVITVEISNCVTLFANRFSIQGPADNTMPYGVAFLSGALAQTLVFWFKQETPLPFTELSDLLMKILAGKYYQDFSD
ncbi:MAG: TetR/AcrR family transcriptional regulator [Roseburia sp.]|nr:TetR/AcrR family transcriptional regulator [Roseburia sp.]